MPDHVEIVLCMQTNLNGISEKVITNTEAPSGVKKNIWRRKREAELYRDILEANLTPLKDVHHECDLDVDLMVSSFNTIFNIQCIVDHRRKEDRWHSHFGMMRLRMLDEASETQRMTASRKSLEPRQSSRHSKEVRTSWDKAYHQTTGIHW